MKFAGAFAAAVIFLFNFASYTAAQQKWVNFTNTDNITSIAVRTTNTTNELWLGVRGGVIRYDLDTNEKRVYTRADGLATNDIFSVAVNQFSDKLSVWAGGKWGFGISEFDGTQWITYNVSPSIWNNRYMVTDMKFGLSGNLWLAALYGGAKFNTSNRIWTSLSGDFQSSSLDIDKDGTIWIGSYQGLNRFKDGTWTTFDTSNSGILSNSAGDVAVDSLNRIWIANGANPVGGVTLFDGTDWTIFDPSNTSMPTSSVYLITVDSEDNIWAVDFSPGIMKYDGSEWTFYDTTNSPIPKEGTIRNLAPDNNGNIYFATAPVLIIDRGPVFRGGGEVLKFDGSVWSTLSVKSNGLPYSPAQSIAEDQSENIWFGTLLNGITMFDGSNWHNFDVTNTPLFESNFVKDIGVDNDGVLWFVGTSLTVFGGGGGGSFEGGVTSFDGNEWRTYNTSNSGLIDNNVSSVAIDQNNNKWFGYLSYLSKGVSSFDGTTWTNLNTSNSGLASDTVAAIAADSEGSIWFGHGTSGKGVSKFDGNSWSIYNTSNSGLCDDIVRDIDIGPDGAIWFLVNSGHDSEACKYDGTDWETYAIPLIESQGGAAARSITVEGVNKIWVGTFGDGALSFDGTDWITYDVKNSQIGYQFINDILVDSRGNKWFAAQDYGGGVSVFNENGVTVGIEEPNNTSIPKNFLLLSNYPNPFNSSTRISFTLPKEGMTRLVVYDLLGREVEKLIDGFKSIGKHEVTWDASNVSSGIYFYRLQASDFILSKKMLLLK